MVVSAWLMRCAQHQRLNVCRDYGRCGNISVPLDGLCPYPSRKDLFYLLVAKQCPATSPFCVIDTPFAFLASLRHRCSTGSELENNTVRVLSAAQLLSYVTHDSYEYTGISDCMLTVFYSPDCVFSRKMVPLLGFIPKLYPKLLVVAADVSQPTKLHARYGILATPTLLLWENGFPVARMKEAPFTIMALRNFIEKYTDLEATGFNAVVGGKEQGNVTDIKMRKMGVDWYQWISRIAFVLSILYFFFTSNTGRMCWETLRKIYIMP